MSQFRPTRASPPFKPTRLLEHVLSADVSVASTHGSISELTGLSPDDIDFLDAVINRAGPSVTDFSSVATAYRGVLRDRGLNPREAVYFEKLIKLGMMKGKNWGDKWNAVKARHSRASEPSNNNEHHDQLYRANLAKGRGAQFRTPVVSAEDTRSTPSHAADLDTPSSSFGISTSVKQSKRRPRVRTTTSSSSDDLRRNSLLLLPDTPPAKQQHRPWKFGASLTSDSENTCGQSTTRLAATRRSQLLTRESFGRKSLDSTVITPAAATKVIASARERRESVIIEDDAWNKIRMERDEAEADVFRRTQLLERCWKVWTQLYQWIMTTSGQVARARDNMIMKFYFRRWSEATLSRQDLYQRISIFSDNRCRRRFLTIWRHRLRGREQDKWRQDMRQRMNTIREKREKMLCQDAWVKWRQMYRSCRSGHYYTERLVRRFYGRWRTRLSTIHHSELIADDAFRASEERAVLRYWDWWRTARQLQFFEHIMSERIDLRLMRDTMSVWEKNMSEHRLAMEFHERRLVKSSIRSWKAAQDRLCTMESRALKYTARQDGLLVRAVFRVWNARRQGKAVERLKASNLTYAAWSVWKQRLQQQSYNNDLALAFVMRSDSANMVSLFHKWRQAYAIHRDAHVVAVQYDTEQICYKALLVWRMKLREKLKMVRMAKRAVNFSAIRHAWKVWHEAMNRRATERRLAEFEKRRMGRVFYTWLLQARQVRQRRLAEKTVQSRIEKRILQCTLMAWTNHVIAIRLRELDIAQSHNVALQNVMFKKWQKVYAHRLEVLSLLQSYILVKREDNMRRVFTRWLGLARINRHRRITLKEKEDEFKISVVACFWDKWRDRFSAERLRPIECMIQTEKNALFRAFGLWHSKTKSLPAIRLYANNTKAKYFKTWRQAMPRALQATKAREIDRHSTIRKYLDKWVQIHRTKMALKAVARARYLRLPTAAPRQTRPQGSGPNNDIFPRVGAISREPPSTQPTAAVSLLRPRPFSERSPGLRHSPRTRESSPTGSRASFSERASSPTRAAPANEAGANDGARTRLWQELRGMQRKSRPSSLHSRPRE
ncbi:hypothetical protein H2248_009533 [Termitomyces sp. 'cryptogamus']|nr:hypothetical protein H2248_009533 [Termitomyces sp. 'cryptogamus']